MGASRENLRATRVFCFQCLLIHEQGTLHHLRTHSHDQSHPHTGSARLWRQAGVWSRKPSGWSKWRSPPSSLPLTLLINITKAYLRKAHHKVTSRSRLLRAFTCQNIRNLILSSPSTGTAPLGALKAALFSPLNSNFICNDRRAAARCPGGLQSGSPTPLNKGEGCQVQCAKVLSNSGFQDRRFVKLGETLDTDLSISSLPAKAFREVLRFSCFNF